MNTFSKTLESNRFLILDGAVATELERKGANLNDELWSAKVLIEQPELIRSTHLEYLEAGADIVCTTTYQATFEGFLKKGLTEKEAITLFEKSVQIANEARSEFNKTHPDKDVYVAASIGPYGAYLADGSEYSGDYNIEASGLKEFHRKRLELLLNQEIDLLIFETIPNKTEVLVILELLSELCTIPVLFSLSCKDSHHLRDGTPLAEIGLFLGQSDTISVIGVNCLPSAMVGPILAVLSSVTTKPLMAYPNSGEGWDAINKCWLGDPESLNEIENWQDWLNKGAKIIGGCCRTKPADINRLYDFRMGK